jgi:hypothetical protein
VFVYGGVSLTTAKPQQLKTEKEEKEMNERKKI